MTNAELQALVAQYMHRVDLSANIPGFIELARTRINRDMRVRENIVQTTETPTVNPRPLPADFLEMRSIYFLPSTRRVTLTLVGREALNNSQTALDSTQRPRVYSIDGTQIETQPGGIDIEFTLLYYAAVAELVADDDTNLLMSVYPMTWLYATLIEGHTFTQDLTLAAEALSNYTSELSQANSSAKAAESGAGLEIAGASSWFGG